VTGLGDALAFTGLWPAAVAAGLTLAAAAAMGVALPPAAPALAFCGALCVYAVDRLRDRERDRGRAPARTAFVARHRDALGAAAATAGGAAAGLALWLGPAATALCAAVAVPGFLHRRLKGRTAVKGIYVSAAWVAVAVGLPALVDGPARHLAWTAAVVGLAVAGNVVASNLEGDGLDAGGPGPRRSPPAGLGTARALAAGGAVAALAGPALVRPLAAVPAALLAALALWRPGERYRLLVVDGALLAGAAAAVAIARL